MNKLLKSLIKLQHELSMYDRKIVDMHKNKNIYSHWIDTEQDNIEWDEDEFVLSKNTREKFIRNVLCDIKGHIDRYQNIFDFNFYKMNDLDVGFGFRCFVTVRKNMEFDVERFDELVDFITNTLNYLIGTNVNISVSSYGSDGHEVIELFSY